MSKRRSKKQIPPTGELRQSQLLTTFGPGSMVDLPEYAVLIGGLDHWQFAERKRVSEERLEHRLRDLLSLDELALYEPPVDNDDPTAPRSGVAAFLFPTWFLAQVDETYKTPDGRVYRTRPLIRWDRLVKRQYLDRDRKLVQVVPVRFVQACVKGHISDIDWYAYVRDPHNNDRAGQLWLDEGGAGNDFAEIYVRDERSNNRRRPLADATVPGAHVLGSCTGRKPWLGPRIWDNCREPNRLLVRSASNAYFSQTLSVIHIPDTDTALKEAVDGVFEDFLQYCESVEDVIRERRKQRVMNALEGHSDEAVWTDIKRRKSGAPVETRSIKQAEIETLMASPDSMGEDVPDGDFYARARSLTGLPEEFQGRLDRVVLIHRLREVVAQVGFTRFEDSRPDIDGELSLHVESASLARETTWLPAIENKGEGVFLTFSRDAIEHWLARPGVQARAERLLAGFNAWKERKRADKATFPGLPYVMLHSLSHLLITAVALECGYSASAIRERVYAGAYGYGILLHTGTGGSEGTLGGLVEVGRDIESHLQRALELGRLCSNDPICSQHDPGNPHEERFLHGSACHGCLHRRDELRAAQRVSRPGAGGPHCNDAGHGFLRRGDRLMSALRGLGRPAMKGLAAALEGGRIAPPFRRTQLQGHIPNSLVEGVLGELQELARSGMAPPHIAYMLRLLVEERTVAQAIADRVELVWSGTEVMAGASRDTAVVVQELFREARESILIASYALDTGNKAKTLFGPLAARMDVEPTLRVRLFVNVHRKHQDETAAAVLLREFADNFRRDVWPGERLPEVFHDPRSLATEGKKRACLHAKCIVVDEDRALITSANFTEAAHERNIEAGTVITDTILARALKGQFDTLVDHGALKRVPGL